MKAFSALGEIYNSLGIENPCKALFYVDTGIEVHGQKTYQTAFQLPRVEADFRAREFNSLLTERLDQCTPDEIAAKSKNIRRLYGRFIYWAGVNAGILATQGLLPTDSSFCCQNWVISRHKDGYGLFRVDHTSTIKTSQEEAMDGLLKDEHGVPHIVNNFSVFPARVEIAADPQRFPRKGNRDLKFSEILHSNGWLVDVGVDESAMLAAHRNVFNMGLSGSLKGDNAMPIPEEMFLEALA